MQRRRLVSSMVGAAGLGLTGFAWLERLAAPNAVLLDPHWTRADPAATAAVDHGPWAAFLARYVEVRASGANRVRYAAVAPHDRAALIAYVDDLARTEVTALAPAEQLALWLNLYNALTLRVVLDAYPVASIKDVTLGGRAGSGPWRAKLVTVEGRALSLDDIEHGIVRPLFAEPRIHYAVNCAAVGCPSLWPEPFRAAALERQLDDAGRRFVADPRGVSVDTSGRVTASSLYNWFQADFGGSERAVLDHLRGLAPPALAERLAVADGIDAYAYDWALNAA